MPGAACASTDAIRSLSAPVTRVSGAVTPAWTPVPSPHSTSKPTERSGPATGPPARP
ncbi:hypothetical protein BZZ08_06575 [Streptomyces sp. MH60]|nr:hypothetical protein BZZ08_06575 [Streptomyces sp. MH60]